MLKKPCPWCDAKISQWQLGHRPKSKPSFFTLFPNLTVCPYCANPVKLNGKSLYALFFFIPVMLLGILLLPIISEYELPEGFVLFGVVLTLVATFIALVFGVFEKDYDS